MNQQLPEWKIAAEISTNAHTNTAMTAADTTLTAENREQTEWRCKFVEQLVRESTTMKQLFTSSLSHHGSDTTGCCDRSGKRKSYCLLYCSTELLLLMGYRYILCLFFYIAVRWFWCCDIFVFQQPPSPSTSGRTSNVPQKSCITILGLVSVKISLSHLKNRGPRHKSNHCTRIQNILFNLFLIIPIGVSSEKCVFCTLTSKYKII